MKYIIFIIIFISILYLFYKTSLSELFSNDRTYTKQYLNNLKICICMSETDNIYSYSKLSEYINTLYAKKHGYDFKMFNVKMTDRSPQWCKIDVINTLLNKKYDYDYLFWIDADAFFNIQSIPLETFITPNKNIIICDDIPNSGRKNTINTGTFFVKCNDWSRELFKSLWNYKGDYLYKHFHEQTLLEYYINNNINNIQQYIDIKPCRSFNMDINQLNDGTVYDNFIIHLMATSQQFRIKFMKDWILTGPKPAFL